MAADKVFGTYELLENILSNLTSYELGTAIQVHPDWRALIQRSRCLASTTPLTPTRFRTDFDCFTVPQYSIPIDTLFASGNQFGWPTYRLFLFKEPDMGKLVDMTATDFVSEPPVQALHVCWIGRDCVWRARDLEKRLLYADDGIRVGHVQAFANELGGADAAGVLEGSWYVER